MRAGYQTITVEVPTGISDHVQRLLSHIDEVAAICAEVERSAIDLDANRFQALHRELELAQRHREALVVLVQVAWVGALANADTA